MFDFCLRFLGKDKKGAKANLLLNLLELLLERFSFKNISRIGIKIFAAQCFFTDHLKPKTVNKRALQCM